MDKLRLKDETHAIIGAAMEVYNELGCGFLEAVYQEAMQIELRSRGVPFEPQKLLAICYKGIVLEKKYIADLVCYGLVIVELKVAEKLTAKDESQLLNYMHATGLRVGLLLNFGGDKDLEWKRMVL